MVSSTNLLKYVNKDNKIIDLTAGCGGNLISFGKYFNNVTGLEIDKQRFDILKNNLSSYNINVNILNDEVIKIKIKIKI